MEITKNTIMETILTLVIIGGIILGITKGYRYFIIPVLAYVIMLVLKRINKANFIKSEKARLRKQWGKDHKEKRPIEETRKLFDFLPKNRFFYIDEITWRDLNMDSVIGKIDHTKSLPGMNYLYNILRNPLMDKEQLIKRNNIINNLMLHKDIAIDIQWPLSILGKKEGRNIFHYFENGIDIKTDKLIFYKILSILPFLAAFLFFIDKSLAFTGLMIVVSINAFIYQNNKNKIFYDLEAFNYLGSLVKCLRRIKDIDSSEINLYKDKMDSLLKSAGKIEKNITSLKAGAFDASDLKVLLDFINMVTLRESILFYSTINLVNKNIDNFVEIYKIIGEIDAHISIASYRESLKYFSHPDLIENNDEIVLDVKDLYHPLLDKPVAYSFSQHNMGGLITGSNASGKSTFLRTIGLNALFSQTLYMVLAKGYKGNYFRLLSSIGMADSIEEGDSYFMAEAKSLKRIIDNLNDDQPVLCILDEIFRGTNTIERINAAKEVLDYIVSKNSLIFAATHDLELTTMVDDKLTNYHFRENIKEKDIEFDYILREGPSTSRNAIAILRYLDYPKVIYENAEKRVAGGKGI